MEGCCRLNAEPGIWQYLVHEEFEERKVRPFEVVCIFGSLLLWIRAVCKEVRHELACVVRPEGNSMAVNMISRSRRQGR